MFTKDYHATMFTTDTRVPSCPIRIVYVRDGYEPGEALHMARIQHDAGTLWVHAYDAPIAIIKGTEFSDYTGRMAEKGNYRALLATPGIIRIIGHHGYQALAYDATLGPVPADEDLCGNLHDMEVFGDIE